MVGAGAGVSGVAGWVPLPRRLGGCPRHGSKPGPCDRAGGGHEAFVVGHLGTNIGEVLSGKVHPNDSGGCMLKSASIEEQVISEYPRFNSMFPHAR